VSAGLIFVFPRVWCIVSFLTTALVTSDSRSALLFIVVAVYEIYHGEGKWGHWGQLREIDFFYIIKLQLTAGETLKVLLRDVYALWRARYMEGNMNRCPLSTSIHISALELLWLYKICHGGGQVKKH
jgi:hypothetical protein